MTDPATTNEKQLYSEVITEYTGDALKDYCGKCWQQTTNSNIKHYYFKLSNNASC